MASYIRLFNTHSQYTTYIEGSDILTPNVSLCESSRHVHFNPKVPITVSAEHVSNLSSTEVYWTQDFKVNVVPDDGYSIVSITVIMGGIDVTTTTVSNNVINIPHVENEVSITITTAVS